MARLKNIARIYNVTEMKAKRLAFGFDHSGPPVYRADTSFLYGRPPPLKITTVPVTPKVKPRPPLTLPPDMVKSHPIMFPKAPNDYQIREDDEVVKNSEKVIGLTAASILSATRSAIAVMPPGREKDALEDLVESRLMPLAQAEESRDLTAEEVDELAKLTMKMTVTREEKLRSAPGAKRAVSTLKSELKELVGATEGEVKTMAREALKQLILAEKEPGAMADPRFVEEAEKQVAEVREAVINAPLMVETPSADDDDDDAPPRMPGRVDLMKDDEPKISPPKTPRFAKEKDLQNNLADEFKLPSTGSAKEKWAKFLQRHPAAVGYMTMLKALKKYEGQTMSNEQYEVLKDVARGKYTPDQLLDKVSKLVPVSKRGVAQQAD